MPKEENKPNEYCFQLGSLSVDAEQEGKKKRTFSGVAYSGEVITDHWYWKQVIFDLDSMQIKGRIPALLEHSPRQRAGAIESHLISHGSGLTVEGTLLSNEFGTQVAVDSDDGFPWQMSVRIEPSSIDEVQAGNTVQVNGKLLHGPITVFRGGRIREVSFCALGADENTMAVAASHSPTKTKEGTDVTELEKAQAEINALKLKNTDLETQNKKFSSDMRDAQIKALEVETGKAFTTEEIVEMKELDDKSFAFSTAQIRKFSTKTEPQKPTLPKFLTDHQAGGGEKQFDSGDQHKFSAGAKAFAEQKGK
ncbi:hypothetical protein [Acinetobacter sp. ANC 3832]|uniref:hypothetical protein n=1 Tax=Acinetobacter sp. ANC 3832 TaxID=1977874 RepID=UPI000A336DDE|nr:hypothetical protein [Acinetobacter sp. ANC 3832]OTG87219.1 hypothetical protein B9T35_17845 [Acinetobacter sp. ANC 3832]